METSSVTTAQSQASTPSTTSDAYKGLNADAFMKMLIAEMQNQDPLNPMNNQEILQQISQIRAIESNTRLTETLQAVMLGQNVSTASAMIGKTIQGVTDDGQSVSGRVERVSIKDGVPKLQVGQSAVSLKNVSVIQPDSTT